MIKRLALIPARGGSKRITNKNLKFFCGKPLIYYSILAVKNSKIFNKIHVSSDSLKILNYSKKQNIKTDFVRPDYLSNDKVGIKKVIKYVVNKYKKKNQNFDEVWLIYATNPFITKKIIINCAKTFKKFKKKSNNALMTVTKFNYPIHWAQKINKNNILEAVDKKNMKKNSNYFQKIFCDAGMLNIYNPESFKAKSKTRYYPFEIPYHSSVDIDNYEDFEFAKKLFKSTIKK
jgi:pseudaminic acid cytidylyltransferase